MKKENQRRLRGKATALALAVCLSASGMAAVPASAAQTTTQAVQKKKGLVTEKNGKRYYYNSQGKAIKNQWKTLTVKKKKYKYYFGADGAAKTGWYSIGSKTYYFNTKGILQAAKTKAMDKTLLRRLDQIIKSGAGVTYRTSDKTAVNRLFAYMRDNCGYARLMSVFKGEKGWDSQYAREMLMQGKEKKGSCYHFAAAYAYLVKRATGLTVRIGCGESNAFNASRWQYHAWCEVKIGGVWYTFDPNVAAMKKLNPAGVQLSAAKCYMQRRSRMINKVYRNATYVNVEI